MNTIVETFKINVKSVEGLINFDREVLSLAIDSIEELHESLTTMREPILDDRRNGKRTLDILRPIHTNDSLKARYSIINNQAIVLLVSYFASAVADIFRKSANIAVTKHEDKRVLDSELKLKVSELMKVEDSFGEIIGDILINKNNISFQDMKSIKRSFEKYFGIKISKDHNVNNIILSHACRHSIAHEAGIINTARINQIKGAEPRDLKKNLVAGNTIHFTEEEINIISSSMIAYIVNLRDLVKTYENR